MKIFADTADIKELAEIKELGFLSGVTTNPTIASKQGPDFYSTIKSICNFVPDLPVFAQVIATDKDGMVEQGQRIADIAPNMTVKIPASLEGIKAIAALKQKGISVCATTIVTAAQALWAALAGADYVAPYVREFDNIGYSGMGPLREICEMFKSSDVKAQVLAAAIFCPQDIVETAKAGADIVTITHKTIMDVCKMPAPTINYFVDIFNTNFAAAGCKI